MAYDNFGRKEITLLSGRVDVHLKNTRQVLTPGKAMIIKDNKSWITKTDAVRATAWTNNKFDFQNIPLSELVKRLENWYDIDINLSNPDNKEVNFSGTFKNEETIWQVLDAIKVYMPIRYKKTNLRKIKITVE
jgi:ferric-dicitrate binding protein FerR (iron transport regulator)